MTSTAQAAAQLDAVLSSSPQVMAVAVRAPSRQDWPAHIERRGRRFAVRWCESALALREALTDVEGQASNGDGVLLMTPLSDGKVPVDVIARLAKARVFQPRGWDIVRQMFDAQGTDARLGKFEWMPQCLIELSEQGAYAPVPSGFLDLETAWRAVLARALGISDARPDGATLLGWTQQPDADVRLARLAERARADVATWLAEGAGPAGVLTMHCVAAGRTGDALPLALTCEVIFSSSPVGQAERGQAAVRLERYVGDHAVSVADGRAWAAQARLAIERLPVQEVRGALDRADALLRELRIADFADLSDTLPHGLELRLSSLAASVESLLTAPSTDHAERLERAAERALDHRLAKVQPLRAARVRMARRVCRWLMASAPSPTTVEAALTWQADEGAFVDWARFRLQGGDELPDLTQAYARLRAEVTRRRNDRTRSFAVMFQDRHRDLPAAGGRVVAVESILDRVLAPLAASHPVLLLVMDGLSLSIFRELFEHPERHGWTELQDETAARPLIGLAALPTITEVSRASLLCGRLTLGAAAQEKPAFAAHPALVQHSSNSAPPKLFHKGDLSDQSNLAPEVRDALANPQQRVVGIVYNAVDDHLSGPDQLHQRWSLEDLRLLLPLLRVAREARRVLVVTADHGHVLEDGTQAVPGGDRDRWRPGTATATDGEIALAGGRVRTADGSNAVICLWSESLRYTGRKNGYHGGVSLQELAVPLSVFSPSGVNVPGWTAAPPAQPVWWEVAGAATAPTSGAAPAAVAPAVKPAGRKAVRPEAALGGLFAPEDLPVPQAPAAPATEADWVGALLASPAYNSQRQLAARVAVADEVMRKLLEALHERGGKLTRPALAQRLGVPEMRMAGLLSAARRVLNLDQAAVLMVDDAAGTVVLNRSLLVQQFRLTLGGGER